MGHRILKSIVVEPSFCMPEQIQIILISRECFFIYWATFVYIKGVKKTNCYMNRSAKFFDLVYGK